MFRNSYDNDSITYSPTGRLFQVEYALEAIKQGSAAVGLVSKTHAVIVALKRSAEELGSYQKKIIRIDDHLGIALAGLSPDARVLSNFMRQQAMSSRMIYDRPIPVSRVVSAIGDKAQRNTQIYGRRPYGVGLLVAGFDETGPHLFEFQPSGTVLEYFGAAIGARSQSARTYLERNFEEFHEASLEDLVLHGLRALRDTLAQDKELLAQNTSIGVVGLDMKFTLYDNDDAREWLEKLGDVGSTRGRRLPDEPQPEATEDAPVTDAPPPEETDTVEPIETDA
ncbi:nucleophile aminohydrolase [Lipomyces tetrasporus]|uniref:Nucleophile aminohydrolase n=1 Tax=Lipomyces tetrasporus TaxID=54092 RepID=A0AAD7QKC0_9ASCO|nr:nucleophile aminohydrolase [Lipomyces tetrasporus]KAJ8096852.1 nucleophile aminohydrolase [Lipomyces tetrasporus]